MTQRTRFCIVLLLAVIGAGLSGLLLLEHHGLGQATVNMICGEGSDSGCAAVSRSAYSQVAGVPLAAIGLAFYLSLTVLLALGALAEDEVAGAALRVALALLGAALAVDLGLLGLQAFAIKAFCRLCLLTYVVNAAAFVVLFLGRRPGPAIGETLKRQTAQIAGAGWLLSSLAVVGAALAAESALSYKASAQAGAMLGTPATSSASDELRQAQEQAKKLQETLDDPNKLQDYMNAKAAREFAEAKPEEVELAGVPSKGPVGAPIRVVEYSDFLCPWCRSLASAFAGFLPQSGNRVAIYFKNYPLDVTCNAGLKQSVHAGSCWMALGGLCAQEQGKFWAYHDKVFGAPPKDPSREDAVRIAAESGLAGPAFEACLSSPKTKQRLQADIDEAKRVGVAATPTVLVNGKKLPRIADFLMAVDKEAQRLQLPPLQPPRAPQAQ